jgi:hypothetical protein
MLFAPDRGAGCRPLPYRLPPVGGFYSDPRKQRNAATAVTPFRVVVQESSKAVSISINKPSQSLGDTHLVMHLTPSLRSCAPSSHLKHASGQGNLRARIVYSREDHDTAVSKKTFIAGPLAADFIARHVAGFVCRHCSYMRLVNIPIILPFLQ